MMEEQYIKYDTAVLAQKKGFCSTFTINDPKTFSVVKVYNDSKILLTEYDYIPEFENVEYADIIAPTQTQLAKGLRDNFNIIVWVTPVFKGIPEYDEYVKYEFVYFILNVNTKELESGARKGCTFEETLEIGLVEALNLIKDE